MLNVNLYQKYQEYLFRYNLQLFFYVLIQSIFLNHVLRVFHSPTLLYLTPNHLLLERETTNKKTGEVETQIIHIHPSNLLTRRIFSRGQFNKDGRWYGGFWQQLPKKGQDLRKDIYIDDEPTDEIDFSGLHPTLLALKKGHKLEGDRYDLGYQVCSTIPLSKQRDIVKRLVLIAINAKSRQKAFGAYNSNNEPVKARDLASKDDLLFRRNSVTGEIECLANKSAVALNDELHSNN